jgi:hypothetical protein
LEWLRLIIADWGLGIVDRGWEEKELAGPSLQKLPVANHQSEILPVGVFEIPRAGS